MEGLFFRIGFLFACSAYQIVYTGAIQVSQLDQDINGVIQHTNFVLGIGILADSKIIADLLLCIPIIAS